MQPAVRQACLQATISFQLRSKSSATGAWHNRGERSQSRRERRLRRQAHNSILKHFCSEADWPFQSASSQSFCVSGADLPDAQLWRWLYKGRETSRRARRGWLDWLKQGGAIRVTERRHGTAHGATGSGRRWLKWLKQGGATQRGREQARHSTWSSDQKQWEERWQEAFAQRRSSEEWQARSRQHRQYFADGFIFEHFPRYSQSDFEHFYGRQFPESARQQTASAGKPQRQQQPCREDVVHAKSLSLLGIQTVRGLTGSRLGEAFRACALAWHPDRHAGPEKHAAEAKFKEVHAAYTVLRSLCVGWHHAVTRTSSSTQKQPTLPQDFSRTV